MDLLAMPTLPLAPTGISQIGRRAPTLEQIAGMMTFVIGNGYEDEQLEASLALLRDAKPSLRQCGDRRLAWLHAEVEPGIGDRGFFTPIKWQELGTQVAQRGDVDVFVATGLHARDAALGAREAGVFLGDVIVCTDQATACRVMIDRVVPGDCVLLHQVNQLAGETLRQAIEMKWTHSAAA